MTLPIPGRFAGATIMRRADAGDFDQYAPVGTTHEHRPCPHDGRTGRCRPQLPVRPAHDVRQPERLQPPQTGHIGPIVVGSLAVGLLTALALVAAPFVPSRMNVLTGVVLLGFAFGWALLAVLSVRFSDQPQRWAAAPAVFLTLAGLISLLPPGSVVQNVFGWVWPPLLLGLVIWTILQAHRQLHSRTRRWVVYPLLVVLALSAIGGGYETVRESIDATAYPAPGQLIDVGGHRLHLNCTGTGSPTVVLEPGHGEVSSAMGWIAPAVSQDTRVCVYDRAGHGWSDPADGPQDAVETARDLHTLLDRAHIPGPYVLAGHSFGGLYVLTFAATYPDQVAGLVLLDSTAPNPGGAPPPRPGPTTSSVASQHCCPLQPTSVRPA